RVQLLYALQREHDELLHGMIDNRKRLEELLKATNSQIFVEQNSLIKDT
ncbi:unnamed protein product, partial [Didymodactylos carnosus]